MYTSEHNSGTTDMRNLIHQEKICVNSELLLLIEFDIFTAHFTPILHFYFLYI